MIQAAAFVLLAWAELETSVARTTCYVHEPVRVTLRIRVDTEFFENNVVQMFQRDFDYPVQVRAPWLEKLDGAVLRATADTGASLVVNGKDAFARRTTDGKFTVLEIERTLLPTRAGELALAAPRLRYVYGTKFREDFLEGRVAVDQRDASAEGSILKLTVRALPDGFEGPVGRFTVAADAAPRAVDAGSILKLTLRIEGEGNFELFDMPRLGGIEGFHVYGALDDKGVGPRTIVYDIAPLTAATVPAIPFTYFDPAGEMRTVETDPIPLTVRGLPEPPPPAAPEPQPIWIWFVPVVLVAVWLLARRRRPRDVVDARTVFAERATSDVTAALTEYLAARLDCPPAAVISPDLAQRLAAAKVPAELAQRTAAYVEALVGARYGGAASDAAAATALVDELERTK